MRRWSASTIPGRTPTSGTPTSSTSRSSRKELGLELKTTNSQNDVAKLTSNVQTFISQGVKGIVMAPQDTAAIAPTLQTLAAKKIPVVTIDTRPDQGDVFMVVRADNRAYGEKACQFLGAKLDGKGKVVMLQGDLASINGRDRTEAFNDCMKKNYPGITVFGEATNWDGAIASQKLQTRLTEHPDIKGVYMQSSFALGRHAAAAQAARPARRRPTTRSTSSSSPTTASPRSCRRSRQATSTPPSPSRPTSTPSTRCTTSRPRSTARPSSPARPTTTAPSSRCATACSKTSSPPRW